MAFQKIKAGTSGDTIDIKKEPKKPYTGTYTGSRQFETKIGMQTVYEFQGEKGKFGIYGFGHLNMLMKEAKQNDLCRVTYLGTERIKTKYGMKDVHQAQLEIDRDAKQQETDNDPFFEEES